MRNKAIRGLAGIILAGSIGGCAVFPDYNEQLRNGHITPEQYDQLMARKREIRNRELSLGLSFGGALVGARGIKTGNAYATSVGQGMSAQGAALAGKDEISQNVYVNPASPVIKKSYEDSFWGGPPVREINLAAIEGKDNCYGSLKIYESGLEYKGYDCGERRVIMLKNVTDVFGKDGNELNFSADELIIMHNNPISGSERIKLSFPNRNQQNMEEIASYIKQKTYSPAGRYNFPQKSIVQPISERPESDK